MDEIAVLLPCYNEGTTIGKVVEYPYVLVLVERKDDGVLTLARKVNGLIVATDLQTEFDDVVLDGSPRKPDRDAVLMGDPLGKVGFHLHVHHEVAEIPGFVFLFLFSHCGLVFCN